ncbi:MAG: hypothetical protein Q7T44_01255 [Parvibaculum sp.]|nr:hypothetical protein [Parvibaculum sp.]
MSKLKTTFEQNRNFPSRQVAVTTALMAAVAMGLAACSATPDALKPAAVYGAEGAAPTPEGTKGFPELADTPDTRPASTSAADQKAIADELAKDRAAAQDKDSALRAGQATSTAAKPSPERQAEIARAAESATETASISPEPETPKPVPVATPAPAKVAAVAAPVAVAAAEPEPVEEPAPAVAPEPEPAKVAAAAPATQPLATPYVAPNLPPEPAKVAAAEPAPVAPTAGTAALLNKIEEPAPTLMASAEPATAPVLEAAPAPAPIVNGIIPMPSRGGHKSFAAVKTIVEEVDEDAGATAKAEPAEEVVDPNAEAPVTAAPTTKVEVSKPSAP